MDKQKYVGYAVLFLVAFSLFSFSAEAIEFRHKPIGPFYLTQGETFTFDFNATNLSDSSQIVEDGTIIKYLYESIVDKVSNPNITFIYNATTGNLNYTPNNRDSTKNFTILFFLRNPEETVLHDAVDVRFIIENVNDAPEIVNFTPYNLTPEGIENSTSSFVANFTDPDFFHNSDNITIEWLFNEIINQTESNQSSLVNPYVVVSSYEAQFGFCDNGIVNITARATDIEGLTAQISWEVNVTNVNREVQFNGTIPDNTWNEGVVAQNYTPLWNLYDFFLDEDYLECIGDNQEILEFIFEGNENITIHVNESTGNITFESPPFWRGEETIFITAIDETSNVSSNNFTLVVNSSGYPPNITTIGNQNAAIGAPFVYDVRVEDPDLLYGDNITFFDNSTLFSISWLNITENVSYGRISFTPMPGDEGNYSIEISVEDLYNYTDVEVFLLTVAPNNPPELNPVLDQNSTQDLLFNLSISAYDLDNEQLFFYTNSSIFGLPLNNTTGLYQLQSINDTYAYFNFTPTNEQVGNYSVNFYVYDFIGAIDFETIFFRILNINDPPELLEKPTDIYSKINQTFSYYVNASDPDLMHGDNLIFASNESILNLTKVNSEQALIQFYPVDLDEGVRSVRINVTDAEGLFDEWIFNLNILPPIAPILNVIENLTALENSEFISLVSATDANDDPLIFTFNDTIWSNYVYVTEDSSVIINGTYNKSQVGIYSINVTVEDTDGLRDSVVVSFEIQETDNAPEIEDPGHLVFYEGITNSLILNIIDLEGDNWTIVTNNSLLLSVSQLNLTNANLTSTPNTSQIGEYTILLTVLQESNNLLNSSIEVNITVMHNPTAPILSNVLPLNSSVIGLAEGFASIFNATIVDPDFNILENITARWYFNGELQSTESVISNNYNISYSLTPNYCNAGGGILSLNLTDYYNFTSSVVWNLSINNTNRAPQFGTKRFSAEELSTGTLIDVNYSEGIFFLENSSELGIIESQVIDFGSSFNKANLNTTYGSISFEGSNLTDANISYSIRTGSTTNSNLWTMPWTEYAPAGSNIVLPSNESPRRYVQIRLRINDSELEYPELENVVWTFGLGSQTIEASSIYSSWIDLSDFFYDPDDECDINDEKNVTAVGNINIEVNIDDSEDFTTTLLTNQNTGTEIWYFIYADQESGAESNNISFTVTESEIPPIIIPISSGGGGGSSSTITQTITLPVEVESPVPIDLIMPESVTIYDNDTIIVPITLRNTLNSSLQNIQIYAESANPNISFYFDVDSFANIDSGENQSLRMTIESYRTYGNYEATVYAIVGDPEFNASKKFFINSIELGRQGDQEFNTKLSFVRDLLSSNPECIELSEQLDQVRQALDVNNVQRATSILDSVSENCRYLLTLSRNEPSLEQPTGFFSSIRNSPSQMLSYLGVIIVMNLLLAVMFAAFYSHPPRRGTVISTNNPPTDQNLIDQENKI